MIWHVYKYTVMHVQLLAFLSVTSQHSSAWPTRTYACTYAYCENRSWVICLAIQKFIHMHTCICCGIENSVVVAPFTVFGWFGVGPKWSYIEPFWSQTGLLLNYTHCRMIVMWHCHTASGHCNWPQHYSLYYATCIYVHVSSTTVLAVCVCVS